MDHSQWSVFHSYTRKQAIEDGVLIDVTETAKKAGFAIPVAITDHAWAKAVSVDGADEAYGQSEQGRLWDVLSMLYLLISGSAGSKGQVDYVVHVNDGQGKQREVNLKAIIHPGDDGEPVLTIMLTDED